MTNKNDLAKSPAAVLFDLDGTLVDTAPDLVGALFELLEDLNEPAPEYARCRLRVSQGARGLIELGLGIGPDSAEFESLRVRFLDIYAARVSRESQVFDGVPELLGLLAQKQLPWGIATNKPARFVAPLLAALNLVPESTVVVTPDLVDRGKPDPAMIHLALKQLGVMGSECLFIGDARQDITAGRGAGVINAIAGWGYIDADEPIAEWGAELQFNSLAALIRTAKQW
ncbi:MAG: HAD-IA family hydrolase [Immundisolibacteraceae bacterium]|nr:HAD-IA family hydrolase [Immundisolibacteraceae bacterium]